MIQGEPVSFWDEFLCEYGRTAWQQAVPNAKDMLNRFLTIDLAMIGGTIALANSRTFTFGVSLAILICLTASMLATIHGLWPWESDASIDCPAEIEAWRNEVINRKKRYLIIAMVFFFSALAIAIGGLSVTHP